MTYVKSLELFVHQKRLVSEVWHMDQKASQHGFHFSVTLFGRFGRRGWLAACLLLDMGQRASWATHWLSREARAPILSMRT